MTKRVYLVGTDTEIGKTTLLEAIIQRAKSKDIPIAPFKPAQSGSQSFEESDCGRIMNQAGLGRELVDLVAPNRYPEDRAPGSVASLSNFIDPKLPPNHEPLERSRLALDQLEQRIQPQWSFSEGAGGLWVPMPGGTWQPSWIKALSKACIVVAPVGLGTINHTILTIDALRRMGHPILGIAWTGAKQTQRPLASENMTIVGAQTNLPILAQPDEAGHLTLVTDFFALLDQHYPAKQA